MWIVFSHALLRTQVIWDQRVTLVSLSLPSATRNFQSYISVEALLHTCHVAFFTSSWNLVSNYRNLVHFVYNHLFGIKTYQPVSSRWLEVGLLIINMQQNHRLEQSKRDYCHKDGIALSWSKAIHVHKPVNHRKVFCPQRMTIVMYRNREFQSKRWLETKLHYKEWSEDFDCGKQCCEVATQKQWANCVVVYFAQSS